MAGQPRIARVITVSTRAASGQWEDRSGPVLAAGLAELGLEVEPIVVVPDGDPVGRELARAVADGIDLVVTTGGTGLTPTDHTPEQTAAIIERPAPGIAEAIRAHGASTGVATAWLSRGIAGIAGTTLIINAPGSPGGARDALAVIAPFLMHALEQVRGSDH
jgi:molybdenum cofactor synthesis domain-containing protein